MKIKLHKLNMLYYIIYYIFNILYILYNILNIIYILYYVTVRHEEIKHTKKLKLFCELSMCSVVYSYIFTF